MTERKSAINSIKHEAYASRTRLQAKKDVLAQEEAKPDTSERELERIEEKKRANVNEQAELAATAEVSCFYKYADTVLR